MNDEVISGQIFALLRYALWGKEIDANLFPEGSTDWDAILKFAAKQTIIGLIADAVIKNAETLKPGKTVLRTFAFKLSAIRQSNAILNDRVAEAVSIMTDNGIPSVLFKGQGNARLYPQTDLRQCGDIDLYIGPDNIDKAYDIFVQHTDNDGPVDEGEKHIHLHYKGVDLELHRIAEILPSPTANRKWQKWTIEQLTSDKVIKYDFNGTAVAVPPLQFNVVFIFNHLYHHFITGGIGLRQLCDWAMLLHTHCDAIDREQLQANLKQYNLLEVWQYFICILVEKLGLPAEESPLYSSKNGYKTDIILTHIYNGGNFGHHRVQTKRPDGYFAGKLHSFLNVTRYTFSMRLISRRAMMMTYLRYLYCGIKAVILDKLHLRKDRQKSR